jgi:hypothetical protein
MNIHRTTAFGIAAALMGKPRAAQSVHISATVFNGSPLGPRYVILVVPEGAEKGTYYECGPAMLTALKNGCTPEEMSLEPFDYVDDADEDDGSDWDRAASAADAAYQFAQEQI